MQEQITPIGRRIAESNRYARQDLIAANIPEIPDPGPAKTPYHETQTTIAGHLTVGKHTILFQKNMCAYWSVRVTPEFSLEDATWIDRQPLACDAGAYYSGGGGTLGDVARVDGCAGGQRPDGPVGFYHIDTVAALCVFVRAVRLRFDHRERWENGFRNLVTRLYGPSQKFDIPKVVDHVDEMRQTLKDVQPWLAEVHGSRGMEEKVQELLDRKPL